jgi:ubiquinone/menaquinone biosynthesis C-methylase UbiE
LSRSFKKWFDDYSSIYDSFFEHLKQKDLDNKILVNHLNLGQNSVICDVGTGTGNSILSLQKLLSKNKIKGEYLGIDVSTQMLKYLQSKSKDIHIICADMRHLPLISDCVDCQTFYFSIHLARNKAFGETLKETRRVLRRGIGKVIIVTIEPNSPYNKLRDRLKGKKRPVITEQFLVRKLKSYGLHVDFTTVVTNALIFETIDDVLNFFEARGLSIENRGEVVEIVKQYTSITEKGIEIPVKDQIFIASKKSQIHNYA